MPIRQNDFVELEYTGRLKEENLVFDTTDAQVAEKNELPKGEYKPVIVCIGQGQLLKGLDDFLQGKEPGKYHVEFGPEQAFGKKNAKLVQMIPASKFKEQDIQPVTGLHLNINGFRGIVRNVTGGRIVVDFNHPLAGKDVVYDLEVKRVVTDRKEQVQAALKMLLGVTVDVTFSENKAAAVLPKELPEQVLPELQEKVRELTGVDVEFVLAKDSEKSEKTGKNVPESGKQEG